MKEVYTTFDDIKDNDLRTRNQGAVLANMFEDNLLDNGQCSARGAGLILKYFNDLPDKDKQTALIWMQEQLLERGYKHG